MSLELLKFLEKIVEYLNFLVDFATNPVKTLQPYEGLGEINLQLVIFVFIGTVLALIITYTAREIGAMPDKDYVEELAGPYISRLIFSNLNLYLLNKRWAFIYPPLVSLLLIFVVSIILHGAAKIGMAFGQILHLQLGYLGGSIHDSINASFAFAAFLIPLFVFILLITGALAKHYHKFRGIIIIVSSVLVSVIMFIYFFSALSATHPNTSWWQASKASASIFTLVVIITLIYAFWVTYFKMFFKMLVIPFLKR